MIEQVLGVFEQDITIQIVDKTVTDAFYGVNDTDYTEQTVKAVVVPHGLSLQEPDTSIGIDSFGKVDVYIREITLKRDDIVVYCGKNYKVIDVSEWDSVLGDYKCYVCQV